MIFCQELNKSFENEAKLFKALKSEKELIISAKKAQILKSCEKGLGVVSSQEEITKAIETTKSFEIDKSFYYFVVNSANILDSHRDMHIDGNWEKTIKEQQKKTFLVFDHKLERSEIIAMKEDIEMFTAKVPFKLLGKSYSGETYCLIYKVKKDKIINEQAREWLEKGYSLEASVRMQYTDISLCMNSTSQGDEKELENYSKFYPLIANKEEFETINYFWAILQAKNVFESSLVLFGSNSATGVVSEKDIEAVDDTSTNEPTNVTQKGKAKYLLM
jgi:hypothetical protein